MTAQFGGSHYSSEPWQEQDQGCAVPWGSWHTFTIYSNFLLAAEWYLGNMVKLYDTSNLALEPTQKPIVTLFLINYMQPFRVKWLPATTAAKPRTRQEQDTICIFLDYFYLLCLVVQKITFQKKSSENQVLSLTVFLWIGLMICK